MNDTDVTARLAEALRPLSFGGGVKITGTLSDLVQWLLPVVRGIADQRAAEALRAAAEEQRQEADQVPWDDEGTHADGHRCAAGFLDRRAAALRGEAGR